MVAAALARGDKEDLPEAARMPGPRADLAAPRAEARPLEAARAGEAGAGETPVPLEALVQMDPPPPTEAVPTQPERPCAQARRSSGRPQA